MLPHFSAVSTPPTTASMHQQSLMYTNQNQAGIQATHQQPQQPFMYQPQEGVPYQHTQTHFTLANTTDPNIQPTGHAWTMLRTNSGPFFTQQQAQHMSHVRHPQQSATGQQPFSVGGMQPFVLVPQTPPPMLPPTSICTNPYQPPPQQFSIHQGHQFQPQTGAIPTGSTTQYIRTFSNGGGGGAGGNTNANGAHINGFNPATHQQLRSFQPQQQPPPPNAVNTGIAQQPFGHHPQHVFMLAQAMPNSAAPPPTHFEALPPLVDRQFQQHQTSTAPSLLHQQLMQQSVPQMPPLHQHPPPQSAPPLHQSPQFQQQACLKEKRPLSIQAPGSTESACGEQQREGSQSGRQSAVFSSNPSPQNQRKTPPTPTNNAGVEAVKESDNTSNNKTEEINVGNDYRKRPQNRHPSFSNKNDVGQTARGSFYNNKYNQHPPQQHSQDVRTFMQPSQNANTPLLCSACGGGGHTWNYCPINKRERDESTQFAELFVKQSLHPALKNGNDGNPPFVSQNNYRKGDNHQQQNFRGGGFNKNFGPRNDFVRHQRYSSGGGNGASFAAGGGNKPGISTPPARTSGYSVGSGPGSVGRQSVVSGGGGGNRKDHQKPHNVFWNKNVQKQHTT